MNMRHILFGTAAAGALALSGQASAAIIGSLGGIDNDFVTLTSAGLVDGATPIATLTGGQVFATGQGSVAALPPGTQGSYLAATQPATLTFTAGQNYLSFLWGSPDSYNRLAITSSTGQVFNFTASSLGLSTNGNQSIANYVQFVASGADLISSVTFSNLPQQAAFEVANFAVTTVPEPATWALMIVGVGGIGGALRRRNRVRSSVRFG